MDPGKLILTGMGRRKYGRTLPLLVLHGKPAMGSMYSQESVVSFPTLGQVLACQPCLHMRNLALTRQCSRRAERPLQQTFLVQQQLLVPKRLKSSLIQRQKTAVSATLSYLDVLAWLMPQQGKQNSFAQLCPTALKSETTWFRSDTHTGHP